MTTEQMERGSRQPLRATVTIPLTYSTSASDLVETLSALPATATLTVNRIQGDRNEGDSYSLTASWTMPTGMAGTRDGVPVSGR